MHSKLCKKGHHRREHMSMMLQLEAMEWEGRAISAEERVKTLDASVDEAMRDNETLHDQLAMLQSMHASLQAHLDHFTHRHE